ncbi:hypothetical protein Tco_0365122 [Tanacetum coccineum]
MYPKTKGKDKLKEEDESDSESDGIHEAEKKFKQLASDEEMARKAELEADRLLLKSFNKKKEEPIYSKEGAKFLHDTIDAQRKFLCSTKIEAIRKETTFKESTKKLMMTYLKTVMEGKEENDSEIMEKKSVIARLNKVSSPDGDYLVIYRAMGSLRACSTLFMERLYEACGVCILELKDGTVIHMLVERRYPLSKDLLQRMLDLGLEVKRESTVALDLIRFIKQQMDED